MHLDAGIEPTNLIDAPRIAAGAENVGLHCIWTAETKHDPFLPLALATPATQRISLGTSIAVAFPRSPTTMAYIAWDMASLSEGRFILGLGTQVKAHIERRFSAAWGAPVEKMRDYIAAMRAVWSTWRTGERLRYEGPYYTLKLMSPFFSPDPLPYPDPPIFIAGVNRGLCRLAGEVCDGFLVHPLHSARYLREAVLPWIGEGLSTAGRAREDVQVAASVFAITGKGASREAARQAIRQQIAFYASTPSYQPVMQMHGWDEQGQQLGLLASRGRWAELPALITDDMLAQFAVEGDTLEAAAQAVVSRYAGLLDRVSFYMPFLPGERDDEWRAAVQALEQ